MQKSYLVLNSKWGHSLIRLSEVLACNHNYQLYLMLTPIKKAKCLMTTDLGGPQQALGNELAFHNPSVLLLPRTEVSLSTLLSLP